MKRSFDIFLAILISPILLPLILIIGPMILFSSEGPAIHWSKRIGLNRSTFFMPKFRTMIIDTPDVATHLLIEPDKFYTPIGKILRKTSLDELPQLWSVVVGDMSFVGPRPALYNQDDLITLREEQGINSLKPGITGWAQINGRDEISIEEKVLLDLEYLKKSSLLFDILIIIKTIYKVLRAKEVSH